MEATDDVPAPPTEDDVPVAVVESVTSKHESISIEAIEEVASASASASASEEVSNAHVAEEATALPSKSEAPPAALLEHAVADISNHTIISSVRDEVNKLVERNELDADSSSSLQSLFREHEALKDKVSKLKALLGRSAKAQREAKVELDASTKKCDATLKENARLQSKIDKLASRPTHMELLADFETNFDKAMLSVGHQQSGGQDTAGTLTSAADASPRKDRSIFDPISSSDGAIVDGLLMQEIADSKQRVEKLQKLNSAMVNRSAQLESELKQSKRSMDELLNKMSHLELEKRMAVMEADQATRAMQEKAASLAEMQMEIDMVTKSAQKAAFRAAAGEEMIKTVKTDKLHVQHLEEKVKVLQEWAVASNQAKTLAQERVRMLEIQLKRYQSTPVSGLDGSGRSSLSGASVNASVDRESGERILDAKKGSLVVGAADVGMRAFSLDPDLIQSVNFLTERVILRWTFDLTQEDADIFFSILKGTCETAADRRSADTLIKNRLVKGGAGGDVENAFSIGRACTLVWSNTKSWIRPRTIKYTIQAVVLTD